ncbi:MAG: sodium:solute symporter family protein [Oscillospiraceae bacterium]|nr:sodium:solute symporter family protein [Oscillospiraceae bacterium]
MSLQIWIVAAYVAVTVGIGLAVCRTQRRAGAGAAFRGAGLGIPAIVCASAGEWLGGTATSGVAEYGFLYGLSGMWYTLANALGVLFLALCFARLYRSLEKVTVPGIVERFYGVKARVVSSVILCLVMLGVGLSQMVAVGKLGQSLLGLPYAWSVAIFAAVIICYTMLGGMKVVSATNMLHLSVMYFGVILAVILGISGLGGGAALREGISALNEETGGNYVGAFSIGWPKVLSWVIASMLGACTAQAGIQPVLAAKDEVTAKKACMWTALVVAPFGIITAVLGIIARIMSMNGVLLDTAGNVVTDGKLALSALMMNLPPVAGGLVLAAILAAIFSTASPIFLAVGTMFSQDICSLRVKSEASLLRINRVAVAAAGIICAVGAILLVDAGQILDMVYGAYALRGAIFIVILYGIYWKKAHQRAAVASMLLTAAAAVLWTAAELVTGSYPIASWFSETYAAVLTAALSMPLCVRLIKPEGRLRG